MWSLYYALSAAWLLDGAFSIVSSLTPQKVGDDGIGTGVVGNVGAFFGFLTILVGLGLLVNLELARGIVNFLAGLNIIFGLEGLL